MNKVSVIMTSYNSSRFIRDTIESILSQTFVDFEFIIVDDCSEDDVVAIIQSYEDSRIHLIRNSTNQGISRSRNIAIDAARGELLAFTDHDDISHPERLERQVAYLDSNPEIILVATSTKDFQDGRPFSDSQVIECKSVITEPHAIRWNLMFTSPLTHSSICLRHAFLNDHKLRYLPKYHFAEDYELYHRLAKLGDLTCLPEILVAYRNFGENASVRFSDEMKKNGKSFLLDVYREFLGPTISQEEIDLIWRVLISKFPAENELEIKTLGTLISRLLNAYCKQIALTPNEKTDIQFIASEIWWSVVSKATKQRFSRAFKYYSHYPELMSAPRTKFDLFQCLISIFIGPQLLTKAKKFAIWVLGRTS